MGTALCLLNRCWAQHDYYAGLQDTLTFALLPRDYSLLAPALWCATDPAVASALAERLLCSYVELLTEQGIDIVNWAQIPPVGGQSRGDGKPAVGRPARRARRLWVGGAPCSGKSTIVNALCQDHAVRAYHCDDQWDRHVAQATPATQPRMCALRTMTWDEIWMREVGVQVEDVFALYREQFPMILADLESMSSAIPSSRRGPPCCPNPWPRRSPIGARPSGSCPQRRSSEASYRSRGPWVEQILRQCSDPATAWEHWMARDAAFAHAVAGQARRLGLEVLWVDGQQTVEQVRVRVEAWLAPYLTHAPALEVERRMKAPARQTARPLPGGAGSRYLLTTFRGCPWMNPATLSTAVCISRARAERVAHEMCGVT